MGTAVNSCSCTMPFLVKDVDGFKMAPHGITKRAIGSLNILLDLAIRVLTLSSADIDMWIEWPLGKRR